MWLWHRPAAAVPLLPLAWEPPYAAGKALKRKKKRRRWHSGHLAIWLSQQLNAISWETLKNFPDESSHPTEFWGIRVNCYFKPLSFQVLYYVAIDKCNIYSLEKWVCCLSSYIYHQLLHKKVRYGGMNFTWITILMVKFLCTHT